MSEAEDAIPGGTKRWVEALTWHETLTEADESQLTSALVREWQTWYAVPENQRLFDQLSQLIADSDVHRHRRLCRNLATTADDYNPAAAIAVWRKASSSGAAARRWRPPAKWLHWLTGAVAVAAMTIGCLTLWRPWSGVGTGRIDGPVTFQTDIGGQKNVHLADGSNITLGGGTKLIVTLSTRVRSVQLIQGEAWFRVAHDPKWPFVVEAGDRAIRAVGTAFLVTRDSDRVVVAVTEGTVAVTGLRLVSLSPSLRRDAASLQVPPLVRVTRGEELSYRDNGTMASVVNANMHAATAWISGRLIFNNESLRYVIENVNRYFPRHISATPAAGRLRFSGVILDGEIEDWLHGLPGIFPVVVDESGAGFCVHMRASHDDTRCETAR